jgi:hypothetical protein
LSACFVISADSTRTTSMGGDKGANSVLIRSASRRAHAADHAIGGA